MGSVQISTEKSDMVGILSMFPFAAGDDKPVTQGEEVLGTSRLFH